MLRLPWITAAGRSGRTLTPARSGSITAYCPQCRNSAHDVQSWAIFSGTQMCGTIVKPEADEARRLVRERAQRREAARGGARSRS